MTVYAAGEIDETPYIAMQLLAGESLADRLSRCGRLTLPQTRAIGVGICLGLQAVHGAGIVHRDLKPANIWLEAKTDRVKILDFGLAEVVIDTDGATSTGRIAGTPRYMSPEQTRGKNLDARSDLFSLGCVLYEMTTGRLAFDGTSVADVIASITRDSPVAPGSAVGVSRPMSSLIMSLLSKDPECRPGSANEVIEHLESLKPARSGTHRWPAILVSLAMVLMVLVGLRLVKSVFRFRTDAGTIELHVDDSKTPIEIDVDRKHVVTVTDPTDGTALTIRVDPQKDTLVVEKAGFELFVTSFTTELSGGRSIHAELKPKSGKGRNGNNSHKNQKENEKRSHYTWSTTAPPPAIIPFDAARVQKEIATVLKVGVEVKNSVGMRLRLIPAGEFQMGLSRDRAEQECSAGEIGFAELRGELNPHRVILTRPYYAGTTEVTMSQVAAVLPRHPAAAALKVSPSKAELPANLVSWLDAIEFCNALSRAENLPLAYKKSESIWDVVLDSPGYRLPTEAEWEFLHRAGSDATFCVPPDQLHEFAWIGTNANHNRQRVGQLKPNAFGLYDTLGNVQEHCYDRMSFRYYEYFRGAVAVDPTGPTVGRCSTNRGSSVKGKRRYTRAGFRLYDEITDRHAVVGFRVVRTIRNAE